MKQYKKNIILLLILIITGALGFVLDASKTLTSKTAPLSSSFTIPTFTEVSLGYEHNYVNENTWSMVGGDVFDIEGDGSPEIFVSGADGQPDLVLAYRDGAVVDITSETNLSKNSATYSALTLDADNDGDDDLLVMREDGVTLYINNKGVFTEKEIPLPQLQDRAVVITASSADFTGDNLPEIYLNTFVRMPNFKPATFNDPKHLTENIVLRNNGNYTFTDITEQSGLAFNQNTFLSRFADLDGDNLSDFILVPNTERVRAYKNLGNGTFEEKTALTDYGFWMGVNVTDFDNDGDPDVYLSNAGNTIPAFLLKGDARIDADQPLDPGWRLLRNDGDFSFSDITDKAGVNADNFAWGSVSADFNNDGLQDFVVMENYIKLPQQKTKALRDSGKLFIQTESGEFIATEKASGVVNKFYGQTPLTADINSDGFADLVFINQDGPVRVFLNDGK